ncbi:MAG: hypothetical protein K0S74_1533 [Chlamydiales bacterium]|jgi:Na+/H+-dicarboxylate symporter|nr:hypothetical protein [Chlamydiales bacterium]
MCTRLLKKGEQILNRFFSLIDNPVYQSAFIVTFVGIFGQYLPLPLQQIFYTLSVIIKDLLMFILPIAVCVYITSALSAFRSKAILFVFVLAGFEFFSNGLSVLYAYIWGSLFRNSLPPLIASNTTLESLQPFFSLDPFRPSYWTADKGTFTGLVVGILSAFGYVGAWENAIVYLKNGVDFVFSKIFAKMVPLFIFGFLLNMQYTGVLGTLLTNYGTVFLLLVVALVLYISFLYMIAGNLNLKKSWSLFSNVLPAGIVAFTSMSSAATMPFTIAAVAKNVKDPQFAQVVIPATTNIQQIGDCIANSFLCLAIMLSFWQPFPPFHIWFPFMLMFVLMRFTTAAVLGGAIFIMLPLYQKYLGFSSEMCALILALNVVLDPFITSSNVMANGALCTIFERVWQAFTRANFDIGSSINEHKK